MMAVTPLDLIRAKKRNNVPLAAWELVIWEAHRIGYDAKDDEQMALAETAANEVADMESTIQHFHDIQNGSV